MHGLPNHNSFLMELYSSPKELEKKQLQYILSGKLQFLLLKIAKNDSQFTY